jgi:transglutaminase-like putative cysteine protease
VKNVRTLYIHHRTRYDYAQIVQTSQHSAHLHPRQETLQSELRCSWTIDPIPAETNEHYDYFGNNTVIFRIDRPHTTLIIDLDLWLQRSVVTATMPTILWKDAIHQYRLFPNRLPAECWPHLPHSLCTPKVEGLQEYAYKSFIDYKPLLECCLDFMGRIFKDFRFDPTFSKVDTPLSDIFKHRRGVCQDFSHLMLSALRTLGIPCRYVSGYLETLAPLGKEKLAGADASHAWVSVYFPNYGWLDFDPTNNLIPGDRHVSMACGRDYLDVSPVRGVYHGISDHTLKVSVDVREIDPNVAQNEISKS